VDIQSKKWNNGRKGRAGKFSQEYRWQEQIGGIDGQVGNMRGWEGNK